MVLFLKQKFLSIYFSCGRVFSWVHQETMNRAESSLGLTKRPSALPRQRVLILPAQHSVRDSEIIINLLSNHVEPHLDTTLRKIYHQLELDAVARSYKMCLPLGSSECTVSCNQMVLKIVHGKEHTCVPAQRLKKPINQI